MYGLGIIILLAIAILFMAIKVLNEYERAVIFRLGRIMRTQRPWNYNTYPWGRQDGQG